MLPKKEHHLERYLGIKKTLFSITRSSRDIKMPNSFLMHIIEKQLRVNGC